MLEYATSKVKLWPACLCPSSPVDMYHLVVAITTDLSASLFTDKNSENPQPLLAVTMVIWF